ncbi:unnamed protein product [Dimorphilus gyrociliatus]|uniref:Fibronectin type-III domain-containing protein n=1 Tax=Dimorphilus gyrociliatus TaxID=2664684 RepID=A0A7I8VB46_9ANNE|nr:unnamed protein product [Dimorphilus gyrociliatus]
MFGVKGLFLIWILLKLSSKILSFQCPNLDKQCFCKIKYTFENFLLCEYLGNRTYFPSFKPSKVFFKELQFKYNSNIEICQNYSFDGLSIQRIKLQEIGLKKIESDCFSNLDYNRLQEMYLDSNLISHIAGEIFSKMKNLNYLNLSGNKLVDLGQNSFFGLNSLTHLIAFGNKITDIRAVTFNGLRNLHTLELHNNNIELIEEGAFQELIELRELSLVKNQIKTLPKDLFNKTKKIRRIEFAKNLLNEIDEKCFKDLNDLNVLDLSYNNLRFLPTKLFTSNRNLAHLDLSSNRFWNLQNNVFNNLINLDTLVLKNCSIFNINKDAFSNLNSLTLLNLEGNEIAILQLSTMNSLTSLEDLNLRHNKLSEISSATFSKLNNLKKLDLSFNTLKSLTDASFSSLTNLEFLSLTSNGIEVISPYSFNGLNHLDSLQLGNNSLSEIDHRSFSQLVNLTYLNLERNKINKLHNRLFQNNTKLNTLTLSNNLLQLITSSSFLALTKVTHLRLENNLLEKVSSNLFKSMTNLKKVSLHNNRISKIEEDAFNKVQQLSELTLHRNKLKKIYPYTFEALKNIQEIDLSYNELDNLEGIYAYAFYGITNLKHISLTNNNLTRLSRNVLSSLKFLDSIFLKNNPWNCNCDIFWFFLDKRIRDVHSLNCSGGQIMSCYNFSLCEDFDSSLKKSDACSSLEKTNYTIVDNSTAKYVQNTPSTETFYKLNATKEIQPAFTIDYSSTNRPIGQNHLDLKVHILKSDSVTVSWGIDQTKDVSKLLIKYKPFTDSAKYKVINLKPSANSFKISNLKEDSYYIICIVSIANTNATSQDCISIKTDKQFKTAAIVGLSSAIFLLSLILIIGIGLLCRMRYREKKLMEARQIRRNKIRKHFAIDSTTFPKYNRHTSKSVSVRNLHNLAAENGDVRHVQIRRNHDIDDDNGFHQMAENYERHVSPSF